MAGIYHQLNLAGGDHVECRQLSKKQHELKQFRTYTVLFGKTKIAAFSGHFDNFAEYQKKSGAAEVNRTPDPVITNDVLYH